MTTKNFLALSLLVCSLVVGYYSYTVYKSKHQDQKQPNLSTSETSTSDAKTKEIVTEYKLPKGEQLYNVSHGKEVVGPKMSQIIFDPLSFDDGATQKIKIVFPEKEIVGSAVVFVTTDTMENQKVTFTKDSKANIWVGEWKPTDTINKRYQVRIYLVGPSGTYDNTMYFL